MKVRQHRKEMCERHSRPSAGCNNHSYDAESHPDDASRRFHEEQDLIISLTRSPITGSRTLERHAASGDNGNRTFRRTRTSPGELSPVLAFQPGPDPGQTRSFPSSSHPRRRSILQPMTPCRGVNVRLSAAATAGRNTRAMHDGASVLPRSANRMKLFHHRRLTGRVRERAGWRIVWAVDLWLQGDQNLKISFVLH
jgi:hypothetical protein